MRAELAAEGMGVTPNIVPRSPANPKSRRYDTGHLKHSHTCHSAPPPAKVTHVANKNWGKILKTVATLGFALWKSSQTKNANQQNTKTTTEPKKTQTKKSTSTASTRATTKTASSSKTRTKNSSPTPSTAQGGQTIQPTGSSKSKKQSSAPALSDTYPGDYRGTVAPQYAPELDGDADPGEIVWTWVPYEEDYSQGKDRPVLLIGYDGDWLLGLMLTSKDHTGSGSRYGDWLDIGSGPWDNQGRDSEIRLDRIIRINPSSMRREGAIMDETTFQKVIKAM